jgi:hypothetical protein
MSWQGISLFEVSLQLEHSGLRAVSRFFVLVFAPQTNLSFHFMNIGIRVSYTCLMIK